MKERDVVELKCVEQFLDAVDQLVQLEGVAHRAKAGSFVLCEGLQVWCPQTDWHENQGRRVRVVGTLSRGSSPLHSFPTATQDENGAWSQGVLGGPKDFTENNFPNLDLQNLGLSKSTHSGKLPEAPKKSKSSDEWILNVESVVVISE